MNIALCNGKKGKRYDGESETLVARPLKAGGNDRQDESHETYIVDRSRAAPIAYQCHGSPFVFQSRVADNGRGEPSEVAYALTDHGSGGQTDRRPQCVDGAMRVRRLTPKECERLQGFPDDWTCYGADGKEISDSARYRMIGNAVCVPVAQWIGERILEAEST